LHEPRRSAESDTRSRTDPVDEGAPADEHWSAQEQLMATLPGLPDPDEPEPNTLPVEPEFAPQLPDLPADPEDEPGHEPH
jgi:hypothetical protein